MSKGKKETMLVVWGETAGRAAEDMLNVNGDVNAMVGVLQDYGLEPSNVRPSTYEFNTRGEIDAFTQGLVDAALEEGANSYTIYGKKEIARYNKLVSEVEKAWTGTNVRRKQDESDAPGGLWRTGGGLAHDAGKEVGAEG